MLPLAGRERHVLWPVFSVRLCMSSLGTQVFTAMCHALGLSREIMPTGILKAEQDKCKLTIPPTIDKMLTGLAEDRPGN